MENDTNFFGSAQDNTGSGEEQGQVDESGNQADNAADVLFGEGLGKDQEPDKSTAKDEKNEAEGEGKSDSEGEGQQSKEGEEAGEGEQEGAPEQYEQFALPEEMTYDKDLADKWSEIAKKHNYTQAAAQEVVDLYAEASKRAQASWQRQQQDYNEQLKKEVLSDPELGGSNWPEARRDIARARDAFGSEELNKLVGDNPILGNHPAFLRLLRRVGASIGEDSSASGRAGSGERSTADVLFGDMPGVGKEQKSKNGNWEG